MQPDSQPGCSERHLIKIFKNVGIKGEDVPRRNSAGRKET